jgi:hypothetical protein
MCAEIFLSDWTTRYTDFVHVRSNIAAPTHLLLHRVAVHALLNSNAQFDFNNCAGRGQVVMMPSV